MMKLFLAAIVVLIPFVYSAPASQYFIYSPAQIATAQAPSVYKLPTTIVQSTTPLKLSDNGKQILYYYPPAAPALAPSYPYQIIAVRDEGASPGGGFDFWQAIQNWFGQAGGGQGESGATGGEAGAAPESSAEAMKFVQRFELLDKDGKKMPEEMKKEEMKKYFILAAQPQYYGSYATFSPFAPLYTYGPAITTITGRSKGLEAVPVEQPVVAVEQPHPVVPEVVPVVKAVEPLVEPLVLVDPVPAASNVQEQVVLAEAPVVPVAPIQARSALEAEKEFIQEKEMEAIIEKKAEEEMIKEEIMKDEIKEEIKLEEKKLEVKEADDPSVAQAQPAAIALSGKGGLSAASPIATSVTGDGGIAVSAPQATSIAGEFPEEAEKKQ
uniref:CSON008852 protein n=1 Tax=Culicoides sonorensis TaxID=179676 RepID=A0A336LNN8_CULSO